MTDLFSLSFECESCLFNGFADVAFGCGARDSQCVGGGCGLGGGNAVQFAYGLFTGGFAVCAVHAFNGVNRRAGGHLMFLELA